VADAGGGAAVLRDTAAEVVGLAGRPGPVRIEADVRAAAFAEAVLGAGRWACHLYLTIGTGISYCAVYQAGRWPGRTAAR
jgi:predicted NBD/HSP70 family sugar kinase